MPRKLSVGSINRVFARLKKTGSTRFSVPSPRLESLVRGRPFSSRRSGLELSGRKRPPRSKNRKTLLGCDRSYLGSGSRYGTIALKFVSLAVGDGTVCNRWLAPCME